MTEKNNNLNSFNLLIDKMEENAIRSLNSTESVDLLNAADAEKILDLTSTTNDLKAYYAQALDSEEMPDTFNAAQKDIINELKKIAGSGCEEEVNKQKYKIDKAMREFKEHKDKDKYDEMIKEQEKEVIATLTEETHKRFKKIHDMVDSTDDVNLKQFIIYGSRLVMNGLNYIYNKVLNIITLALSAIVNTVIEVWNKVKSAFESVFNSISTLIGPI